MNTIQPLPGSSEDLHPGMIEGKQLQPRTNNRRQNSDLQSEDTTTLEEENALHASF